MKKLILTAALLLVASVAIAAPNLYSEVDYDATNDVLAEVILDNQSTDRRFKIYGIEGDSDLSTAVVSIQKADAAGVTTSYTTAASIATDSSGNISLYNSGEPIFIGDRNYRYKITLNSTSTNSLIVTYGQE